MIDISEHLLYVIGSILIFGTVVTLLIVAFKGNDTGISSHIVNTTQVEANYSSSSAPRY